MNAPLDDTQRPSVIDLLLRYPRQTVLIVTFLLFAGLAEGLGVATLMPLISTVAGNETEQTLLATTVFTTMRGVGLEPTLVVMLLVVVAGMALKAALVLMAMSQVGLAMAYVGKSMRLRLLKALMTANWSYFTRQPTGELTTALTTESSGAAAAFWGATKLMTVSIQVVIYLGLALAVSWEVTLGGLLAGAVLFLTLRRLVGIARRAGRDAVAAYNGLTGRLVDSLGGFRTIKVSAAEDRLAPMLEADNNLLYSAQRKLLVSKEALIALQEPIMIIFMAVGLYAVSTFLVVPFEELIMMAFLFQRTVSRIGQVQSAYQQIASSEANYISIERKIGQAETARETHSGARVAQLENVIDLKHVCFAYDGKQVLRDITLSIPAGSLTLIHGPSGSGKSTLVDLITGLRSVDEGEINIDGVPLANVDMKLWRHQIGYVPQELFMFHDTIHHNISLGDPMVTDDDVTFALEAAEATSFVFDLPDGLESTVGERGALLSGGQRQRLSIARALARRPRLLILDEPTTALDPQTELEICRTLSKLQDITILAISHQAQLRQFADPIFNLVDGRLAGCVPHIQH